MTVATEEWRGHLTRILRAQTGKELVNPRGRPTLETLGLSITIPMETPIVLCKRRKLNHRFMFGEASWILDGSNDLLAIQPHMKRIGNYSDNGRTLSGAYGPHVVRQLEYVKRTLRADNESRQAVMTIWQERPEPSKDIPCTVSMQFLIRDRKIHCITSMRSSDAYLGLPYDLFVFSCIAARLRDIIGIRDLSLGDLTVFAGSSHIYQDDFGKAFNCSINMENERLTSDLVRQHDKPPQDFDINAPHGITTELRRVLGELVNG